MKKIGILLLALCTGPVMASEIAIDGIYYNFNDFSDGFIKKVQKKTKYMTKI